jgi:hypothetical protein
MQTYINTYMNILQFDLDIISRPKKIMTNQNK